MKKAKIETRCTIQNLRFFIQEIDSRQFVFIQFFNEKLINLKNNDNSKAFKNRPAFVVLDVDYLQVLREK